MKWTQKSHNELHTKTGNLRLFSVWKMLVWDLDTTQGQHWSCELECVGISKWLCWRTRHHLHQPCQQWWNGSIFSIHQTRKMHVNNFKPKECQHAVFSILNFRSHWSDFSNEDNVGVIPRLLQRSWSHIGSDVSGSHVRSWRKAPKQNGDMSYQLGIFQKVEVIVEVVVLLLFDYWTVYTHTPHHPEHFEKRAMDCWVVTKQQNDNEQDIKWNGCWFVFEHKQHTLWESFEAKQNPLQLNCLQKEAKMNHTSNHFFFDPLFVVFASVFRQDPAHHDKNRITRDC